MADKQKKRTKSKKWDIKGKKLPTAKELHEIAEKEGTTVAEMMGLGSLFGANKHE